MKVEFLGGPLDGTVKNVDVAEDFLIYRAAVTTMIDQKRLHHYRGTDKRSKRGYAIAEYTGATK